MKISIKKFQELHDISQIESTQDEKASLLVQSLMDMNESEVKALPEWKYKQICKEINLAFEKFATEIGGQVVKNVIFINKRFYWLNYDIAKTPMNAGRYVETATFATDIIKNMHKILATMATPMYLTWRGFKKVQIDSIHHEKIANEMLKLDFNVGYRSCVFFCKVFSESMTNSNTYFQTISPSQAMMENCLKSLQGILDGCTMQNWFRSLKV